MHSTAKPCRINPANVTILATAATAGVSSTLIDRHIRLGNVRVEPCPTKVETTGSSNEAMKDNVMPSTTAGTMKGKRTVRHAYIRVAPSVSAASIKLLSKYSRAV